MTFHRLIFRSSDSEASCFEGETAESVFTRIVERAAERTTQTLTLTMRVKDEESQEFHDLLFLRDRKGRSLFPTRESRNELKFIHR